MNFDNENDYRFGSLQRLREKVASVEGLEEELAQMEARRDRKVEAQRKEIVRLIAAEKKLKADLAEALLAASGTETYKDRARNMATIAIQKRAIQERQGYIDKVKRLLRGLATDGDAFQ